MSISSQIVSLFFEGLKNNTLEANQLELIFKDFPQLIDYISENYVVFSLDKDIRKIENSHLTKIEYTFSNKEVFGYKGNKEILDLAMVIKSFADGLKKDQVLIKVPALYMAFLYVKNNKDLTAILLQNLKLDNPFKDAFLYIDFKEYLIQGFNLYSILNFDFENEGHHRIAPLKIKTLNEFLNLKEEFIKKRKLLNIREVNKYLDFKITIKDIMIKNNDIFVGNESRDFNLKINNFIIPCKYKNIQELSHFDFGDIQQIIDVKFEMQEYKISPEEFIDLYVGNDDLKKSNTFKLAFKNEIEKHPEIITSDVKALILLKDYNFYSKIKDFVEIKKESENMENVDIIEKENVSLDLLIKKIEQLITSENNESEINNVWFEMKKNIDFLITETSQNNFQVMLEEKITFEQSLIKYIPKILAHYFSIPSHLRKKEGTNFLDMTVKQLRSINEEFEKISVTMLNEESRKMKVYGGFLDMRLSKEDSFFKI